MYPSTPSSDSRLSSPTIIRIIAFPVPDPAMTPFVQYSGQTLCPAPDYTSTARELESK